MSTDDVATDRAILRRCPHCGHEQGAASTKPFRCAECGLRIDPAPAQRWPPTDPWPDRPLLLTQERRDTERDRAEDTELLWFEYPFG